MILKIKPRCLVRIISFGVALLLVPVGFWIKSECKLTHTKRQLSHNYELAINELSTCVDDMSLSLKKSVYVSTAAGLGALADEIVLQAGTAGAALSSLPIQGNGTSAIGKFLSQVGDFFMVLSKRAANGEEITQNEKESLAAMAKTAEDLSEKLQGTGIIYDSPENWNALIENSLSGIDNVGGIGDNFTDMEEALSDTPSLIYDGPFSDHILTRKSKLLENSQEIDEEKAKTIASEILNLTGQLYADESEQGTMPSYVFSFDGGKVGVTKKGGYISYFIKERKIASSQMSYESAVETAKKYINSLGLGTFKETYYMTDEGICVVNFAIVQSGILCYTDLIKIGVALDNGEVMTYEARGYIMNHSKRTFLTPKYDSTKAEEIISKNLTVTNKRLALIPSGGKNELLCYEFNCKSKDNEEVLVYINTQTLAEEKVLILLKTDGGTLAK